MTALTAEEYLKTLASPEIKTIYEFLSNRGMDPEPRQRAYDLLLSIDRKLCGKPLQPFSNAQLEFSLGQYKNTIKGVAAWMKNPTAYADELAELADKIVWRLQAFEQVRHPEELMSQVGGTYTKPPGVAAEDKPGSVNMKPYIVPGIIVGAYILWKMGAFDGFIKKLGLQKAGVGEMVEEVAGDDFDLDDEDEDDVQD